MHIPSSTYRIQFNKDFTFKDLDEIIEYLQELGISTVYGAPVVRSTPGSMHGYDVTDPHSIDMEIGSLQQFKSTSQKLKAKEMFWLQDIVPNHMAFSFHNFRLMDVLERGGLSSYYHYFDINWVHPSPDLYGKLMVPFLGDELESCIEKGEVKLNFSSDGFTINYFDQKYPLSISAFEVLIAAGFSLEDFFIRKLNEYARQASIGQYKAWKSFKEEWIKEVKENRVINKNALEIADHINNKKDFLKALLQKQFYQLCYWKQTEYQINYRRFFTVNSLICLRMEDDEVFQEYHKFLYDLYSANIIQGLRIDHIDGLNDPTQYITKLRKLFGEHCYIIAEKILEENEDMPTHWPLQGTSGYEFLSYLNQLFTHRKGARQLLEYYRHLVPEMPAYEELVFANKKLILEKHMAGEWNNLTDYFFELQLQGEFERTGIKAALALLMLHLPVYRIYPTTLPLKGNNLVLIEEAFVAALKTGSNAAELQYLRQLFTTKPDDDLLHHKIILFLKRLMQFTGPLTAKGVEDTTFYVYNPLISHDEVGDAPSTLGISIQDFHEKMITRQKKTPLSLNATATHDTKRGEDARLRLNVLSESPALWIDSVKDWFECNKKYHSQHDINRAPSVNDEYFIYQAIVGGFPEDLEVTDDWRDRMKSYFEKVVREAKVNSSWEAPNLEYEKSCASFIDNIFSISHVFLEKLRSFLREVYKVSSYNSSMQTLVKITAPGIPDIYQGCELWDLSFVDPDNRRPVDYKKRIEILKMLQQKESEGVVALTNFLNRHRAQGYEKMFVTWKALQFRKNNPALFVEGEYIPLVFEPSSTIVLAYARAWKDDWCVVIVPLNLSLDDEQRTQQWAATRVLLPENAPKTWRNIFTGEEISSDHFLLRDAFTEFPFTLLTNKF